MSHVKTHILKSINISLKWIAWPVFFCCVYFLFWSLTNFANQYPSSALLTIHFSGNIILLLATVAVLCVVNWWLESLKWKILVSRVTSCSFNQAARSVLMGCSFGFITPNRIGDYAGRTISFSPQVKPGLVTLNLISGFSQFLSVSVCGLVCLYFSQREFSFISLPVLISAAVTLIVVFILFLVVAMYPAQMAGFFHRVGIKNNLITRAWSFPAFTIVELLTIISISLVRAWVFIIQLVLVIVWLAPGVNLFQTIMSCGVYFMVLTVSPSLVFNKLGVRETLSVLILAPVTASPVVAALAVFVLWFVNQVIPVLLGSLLLIKRSVQSA